MGTADIWWESDANISATSIFHTLNLDPIVNSLGSKCDSRPIHSLAFGVFLVLECRVNPVFNHIMWSPCRRRAVLCHGICFRVRIVKACESYRYCLLMLEEFGTYEFVLTATSYWGYH